MSSCAVRCRSVSRPSTATAHSKHLGPISNYLARLCTSENNSSDAVGRTISAPPPPPPPPSTSCAPVNYSRWEAGGNSALLNEWPNQLMKETSGGADRSASVSIIGIFFDTKIVDAGTQGGHQLPCGEVLISPPAVPTCQQTLERKGNVRRCSLWWAIRWCSIPFHFSPHRMGEGRNRPEQSIAHRQANVSGFYLLLGDALTII